MRGPSIASRVLDREIQFKPSARSRLRKRASKQATVWTAADHKFFFTITRVRPALYVAHVRYLEQGSKRRRSKRRRSKRRQCRIGGDFKTFAAAVRMCSSFTRKLRRQVAYHEAGHAVAACLLGYRGVWVDMEASVHLALTRFEHNNLTPTMLAVDGGALSGGGGDRVPFIHALCDELIVAVAGLVAEVALAGYRTSYVEPEVLGRAVHVVRAAAGLPICGSTQTSTQKCRYTKCRTLGKQVFQVGLPICRRRQCQAPAGCIIYVIERAEEDAFALLQANWPAVKRAVNALCKHDRLTFAGPDVLIAPSPPERAGKCRRPRSILSHTHTPHRAHAHAHAARCLSCTHPGSG
jgi:hypothetical protein